MIFLCGNRLYINGLYTGEIMQIKGEQLPELEIGELGIVPVTLFKKPQYFQWVT